MIGRFVAAVRCVHPDRVLTNAGAKPGDLLYLTKPLGGGLVTTAAKRRLADTELVERATEVMATLNAEASHAALAAGAHAMTDVTGFGLLGHLHELCEASGVNAEIDADRVPAIEGALELAADERCFAGGSRRNAEHSARFTIYGDGVLPERRVLLSDAMTSGGLLVAVPPDASDQAPGVAIGRLSDDEPGVIRVTPG